MFVEIASIADQKTRIDRYKELQASLFQGGQVAELNELINHSARGARVRQARPPR